MSETKNEQSPALPVKKRFGSLEHLASNKEKRNEIKRIMQNSLKWYNFNPVKTDEECEQRMHEFFATCAEEGAIPTWEKLALALGVSRYTLSRWEREGLAGHPNRQHIIQKAKTYLASFDSELVMENKVNPTTYIFRAKNYYDMQDKVEHVLTPNNPLGETADLSEIESRVVED